MMLETLAASSLLISVANAQPEWCRPERPITIKVGLIAPTPKSDFSKTTTQLEKFQINTISPYGAHIDTHVGGLTSGTIKVEQKMMISGSRLRQSVCLWPEQIDVVIRLDQKVYVAKDYAPSSCLHAAVWNHEHKHVRVDREIINAYRPLFEQAVREAMNQTPTIGPLSIQDEKMGQEQLMEHLTLAVNRITTRMETDRNARQQAVDTKQEYDRVARLCQHER